MRDKNTIRKAISDLVGEYYRAAFCDPSAFEPGKDPVHYAGRVFDEHELKNLVNASLDFWLTEGRFTEDFSEKISEFLGVSNHGEFSCVRLHFVSPHPSCREL